MLVIDDELNIPSDHEVILCSLVDPEQEVGSMITSQDVTGVGLRAMLEDSRKEAAKTWHLVKAGRNLLEENSIVVEMEQETESIGTTLITELDTHGSRLRVTAPSKRW